MPPPDTGFPDADARDDFTKARRRAAMARLAGRLALSRGDVDPILPFDEVVAALGVVGQTALGLQSVAVDTILGTVGRTQGFDRAFRPTTAHTRERWVRIANAIRRGEPMPPVDLLRIGEVHFVRDGHHRVSVARAFGWPSIDAHVTEVHTRVGLDRQLTVADLPYKSHERVFHERVPLPGHARQQIRLSDPWDYAVLAEAVEAWAFRAMQDRACFLDRPAAARLWFDDEFAPVTAMLRESGMLDSGTAADAYIHVAAERYRLLHTHEWTDEVLARVREAG